MFYFFNLAPSVTESLKLLGISPTHTVLDQSSLFKQDLHHLASTPVGWLKSIEIGTF